MTTLTQKHDVDYRGQCLNSASLCSQCSTFPQHDHLKCSFQMLPANEFVSIVRYICFIQWFVLDTFPYRVLGEKMWFEKQTGIRKMFNEWGRGQENSDGCHMNSPTMDNHGHSCLCPSFPHSPSVSIFSPRCPSVFTPLNLICSLVTLFVP